MKVKCKECGVQFDNDKQIDFCEPCRILCSSKAITEDSVIPFVIDSERFLVEPVLVIFTRPKKVEGVRAPLYMATPIYLNMTLPNLAKRLGMAFSVHVTPEQVTELVTQSIRQGIFKIISESESRVQIFFCMSNYLQNPITEVNDSSKLVTTLISKVNSVIKHQS